MTWAIWTLGRRPAASMPLPPECHQERERERRALVREMEDRERHVQDKERQAEQVAQQELATLRRDKANLQAALDAHTNLVCPQRHSSHPHHLNMLTLSLCYYYLCKMGMEWKLD